MPQNYELADEPIPAEALSIPRASAFAHYVATLEDGSFSLDACRRIGDCEVVCVTARAPDIPQRPVYDIRYAEPLAVLFQRGSSALPDVLALRADFPETPHRYVTLPGQPKALCLFAEAPEDLNLRWTASLLAGRILWWLHGTAYGTLHADDQPVEPLFGGLMRPLIFPPDIFTTPGSGAFAVSSIDAGPAGEILVAERAGVVVTSPDTPVFAMYPFLLPAQKHGPVRAEPRSLRDLQDFCMAGSYDLLADLAQRLHGQQIRQDAAGTILLLAVPVQRTKDGEPEQLQFYGFRCCQATLQYALREGTLSEEDVLRLLHGPQTTVDIGPGRIGELLGVLARDKGPYVPLIRTDLSSNAASVALIMLAPQPIVNRVQAAAFSGHDGCADTSFLAIGQGALGSQVFANLARQGYGTWTLVDDDYFAPHNVIRHALVGKRFGVSKAAEMARLTSESFNGNPIATAIAANVINPGSQAEAVAAAAHDASVILDMSGSGGVCRHIALDVESDARRMCALMSPSGRDLVVMAEGAGRKVRLDTIEAQYLRAVLDDPRLAGHFDDAEHTRYGGSCRDLTARLSQELVALHAAIGARAVREAVASDAPMLTLWRCDHERMTVERHDVAVADAAIFTSGHWTVVLDEAVHAKLAGFREAKLPGETCGVLLGTFDMLHKRVYVCGALPAPPDSIEEQTSCERGVKGLDNAVVAAAKATYGQVGYVGEWHSHPTDAECLPSPPDLVQMQWVERNMHPEEKPGLIVIVGDGNRLAVCLTEPPVPEEYRTDMLRSGGLNTDQSLTESEQR